MPQTLDISKLVGNYNSFVNVINDYDEHYDMGVHQVALIESFDLLHESALTAIRDHLTLLGETPPEEEIDLIELAGRQGILSAQSSTWLDSIKHKVSVSEKNDDQLLGELLGFIRNLFYYAVAEQIDYYRTLNT